jgi:hypothetical protein
MSTRFIICTLTFTLLLYNVNAQAPNGFNYQGIARDQAGQLITSHAISCRVSILDQTPTGTELYIETQSATTSNAGLFSFIIGNGTIVTGTFNAINWSAGNKYIKVEIDLNGGTSYSITSTSQLMSVPYALFALNKPDSTIYATHNWVDSSLNVENVLWYGADPTGQTDATAAFNAALEKANTSKKKVYAPHGKYLITGTAVGAIIMAYSGQYLYGDGYNTVIQCTNGKAVLMNGNFCVIEGIRFTGSLADGTNTGIYVSNRYGSRISDCFFENFGGRVTNGGSINNMNGGGGILVRGIGGGHVGYTITNNFFLSDSTGINFAVNAEYNIVSNNHYYGCHTAIANWCGNNSFTNESITNGYDGYCDYGTGNSGHSSVTNLSVNHNSGKGIVIQNEANGMTFVGAMIYYDSVVISNSTDVKFVGCDFGTSVPWLLTNNTNVWLTSPKFTVVPNPTIISGEGLRTILEPAVQILADGTTINWNVLGGKMAKVSLAGTGRTLSILNAAAGDIYQIEIVQGTGSNTITSWPSGILWKGGSTPVLSSVTGTADIVKLYYNGANFLGSIEQDYR